MDNNILERQLKESRLVDAGDFPKVVLIDTISFCNLRCSMCVHQGMKRKRGIMSWELLKKIIDEIAAVDRSVRVWMVFFGEPLILKRRSPSIFDMIKYAKNRGLTDIVLNSNGNLLDDVAAIQLVESGLNSIYVGIDAFSAETYEKIRVGGDYHKTVNNVLNLIHRKRMINGSILKIFVQFVEMDINQHEKENFTQFWTKHGAIVKIRPKVSWAGAIDAPNLVLDDEKRWPCHWAMQTMSITDSGKVVTCAVDLDARFVAGEVTKQTLKEVWNGKLKELRNLHISRQFDQLPENCRFCKDWQAAWADYHAVNS